MKKSHSFNESAEMYLKAIAELADEREPVPVTSIANRLRISTVSASEMIHRLQDRALLNHIPYKGVCLTEEGRRRANGVIRRHRLWECFLTHELEITWEKVHEYACRLEHVTGKEVTEALADYLGNPETCPHGNPIPSADGEMPSLGGIPLSDLEAGETGAILCIRLKGDYEMICNYLAERRLKPGSVIEVEEVSPVNGPISIRANEKTHVLRRGIASRILVDKWDRNIKSSKPKQGIQRLSSQSIGPS